MDYDKIFKALSTGAEEEARLAKAKVEAPQDVTRTLQKGGPEAGRMFFLGADQMYGEKGMDGVLSWVRGAFKMIPEEDQETIICAMLEVIFEKRLTKEIIG